MRGLDVDRTEGVTSTGRDGRNKVRLRGGTGGYAEVSIQSSQVDGRMTESRVAIIRHADERWREADPGLLLANQYRVSASGSCIKP